MILEFLLNLLVILAGVALGGYILFFGRRVLSVTLGIVTLAVSANVIAVLVADVDSGRELVDAGEWTLVLIAVAIGGIGVALGRFTPKLAGSLIGIIAGANVALWLRDIAIYGFDALSSTSEQMSIIIGVALLIGGGLAGLWAVQKNPDEALMIITMIIGAKLIVDTLQLSETRSITVVIMLSLALAGILVQYSAYLRELKFQESRTVQEQMSTGLDYFINLDLDSTS